MLMDDADELQLSAQSMAPSCLLADCPDADAFVHRLFPLCRDLVLGLGASLRDAETVLDDWMAIFFRSWHDISYPDAVAPALTALLYYRRLRLREGLRATYRGRHTKSTDEYYESDDGPSSVTAWLDHYLSSVAPEIVDTLTTVFKPWPRRRLAELLDVPAISLGVELSNSQVLTPTSTESFDGSELKKGITS